MRVARLALAGLALLSCLGAADEGWAGRRKPSFVYPEKALSLSGRFLGDHPLGPVDNGPQTADINAPDRFGNDTVINNELKPRYVRLFVPWDSMVDCVTPGGVRRSCICAPGEIPCPFNQGAPAPFEPFTWDAFKTYMDTHAKAKIDRLREAIQKIGGASHILLAMPHTLPSWVNRAAGTPPRGFSLADRLPDKPLVISAWAWLIKYLMVTFPEVHGVEIMNEPNGLAWPRDDLHERLVCMIKTAQSVGEEVGFGGFLYFPATSDVHETKKFTRRLLARLQRDARGGDGTVKDCRYRPNDRGKAKLTRRLRWSQHNYGDIRDFRVPEGSAAKRARIRKKNGRQAKTVLGLLACSRLRDFNLYLTEGGAPRHHYEIVGQVNTPEKEGASVCQTPGDCQKRHLSGLYDEYLKMDRAAKGARCPAELRPFRRKSRRGGRVRLWTQYQLHSSCADRAFATGLFDRFTFGPEVRNRCDRSTNKDRSFLNTTICACRSDADGPPSSRTLCEQRQRVSDAALVDLCTEPGPAAPGARLPIYDWFRNLRKGL